MRRSAKHMNPPARAWPRPASWSAAGRPTRSRASSTRIPTPRVEPVRTAIDVEDRDAIDGSSAELIRRPILEFLEPMLHVDDADVVWLRRGDVRTFQKGIVTAAREGASREVWGQACSRASMPEQRVSAYQLPQIHNHRRNHAPRPSPGAREARALTRLRSSADTQRPATDPADR